MKRACLTLAAAVAIFWVPAASFGDVRWNLVRDGGLTMMGDQSSSTLKQIAVEIGQFRAVVGSLIRNAERPPSVPTIVFVLGTQRSMEPLLPLYNGKPAHIGGYFRPAEDANYIVMSLEGGEESSRVTYHEHTRTCCSATPSPDFRSGSMKGSPSTTAPMQSSIMARRRS